MAGADDEFSEFVRSSSRSLLRAALVMTGESAAAEDLVQAALAHTWVRWSRLRSHDAAEAYVRRVMTTTYLGWARRRWRTERVVGTVPEDAAAPDEVARSITRNDLMAALRALPAGQRAVIALRYLGDLSEAQAAAALGCSIGAIKSQSSKAIRALRANPQFEAEIAKRAADGRR